MAMYCLLFSSDEMSALIGTSLLFSHTLCRLYRSVYVNVFSTKSNQDLLDTVAPFIYTVLVGVTVLSEAPALDGSGFGKCYEDQTAYVLYSLTHICR